MKFDPWERCTNSFLPFLPSTAWSPFQLLENGSCCPVKFPEILFRIPLHLPILEFSPAFLEDFTPFFRGCSHARSWIWWSFQLRILPDFPHQDETDGSIFQPERCLNVYLAWTELISGKRCSSSCQVTFFAPKNWIAHSWATRPARAQPRAQPRCWHQLDSAQRSSSRKSLKEFIPILSQFYQDKKQFREFVPCGAAIQPCPVSPFLLFLGACSFKSQLSHWNWHRKTSGFGLLNDPL